MGHLVILGVDLNCWPGEQQLHQVVVTAHLEAHRSYLKGGLLDFIKVRIRKLNFKLFRPLLPSGVLS